MSDKSDWTGMGRYIDGTALQPIGMLRRHKTIQGSWVGTMKRDGEDVAIVIHEATHRPDGWEEGTQDEPCLLLFENPAATLLIRDAKEDESD